MSVYLRACRSVSEGSGDGGGEGSQPNPTHVHVHHVDDAPLCLQVILLEVQPLVLSLLLVPNHQAK